MTNPEYIRQHLDDDVRTLALKPVPEGVDIKWCLQQIEGYQLAKKKLPLWTTVAGLWYPPRLAMEQCSSEDTARYKQQLVQRLLPEEETRQEMADLTGGFGVDFSYLAPLFRQARYVEQQPHLCDMARHNFPLLRLGHATVECRETTAQSLTREYTMLYVDPARRSQGGQKTIAIEDCTPNIVAMQDQMLDHSRYALVKLSPMLDITQALHRLRHVSEVHVVSVHGECKELLLVLTRQQQGQTIHCVNLNSTDSPFIASMTTATVAPPIADTLQHYLYEPNASILKANIQDHLCDTYHIRKLHPQSHLYTSDTLYPDFPGRTFEIDRWTPFTKQALKTFLQDHRQANLTVRNFPATVADLRKKLKLKEGGDTYLFATTRHDGTHIIIQGRKKLEP